MHTKEPWYVHRDMSYLIMGLQPCNQIWNGPQGANDQPGWKSASEIRQIARIFGQSRQNINANARLIVSCVNALAGLNPDKVQELVKAADWASQQPHHPE